MDHRLIPDPVRFGSNQSDDPRVLTRLNYLIRLLARLNGARSCNEAFQSTGKEHSRLIIRLQFLSLYANRPRPSFLSFPASLRANLTRPNYDIPSLRIPGEAANSVGIA